LKEKGVVTSILVKFRKEARTLGPNIFRGQRKGRRRHYRS